MIYLNVIAILIGIVCFLAGVAFGFPIGHRLHFWQMQRLSDRASAERAEQERAARLEQVRERAFARVENSAKAAVHRDYGILEAKDLS